MKPSLLYRFLRIYCSVGLWFYFRKWQVAGRDNVPTTGPLIYIANHQNAFIDAILMTASANRNPFYLARAGVFTKPWAAKLLALVHIKPIYRFRDGYSTLKNNDVVMQDCVDLMKQDQAILLFPEGNHNEPWSMRSYQKGFARLAMMFHQQNSSIPLHIVPVGIHYTEHHGFNKRVLVNFGKALSVNEIVNSEKSERENLETLVRTGEEATHRLALDLKPEVEYHQRQQYLLANREYHSDMVQQLAADRKVAASYPNQAPQKSSKNFGLAFLRLPLALYVYITHALLYWGLKSLIKNKIKDPQFISSVKYALGIFTTPVYYKILTIVVYAVSGSLMISFYFFASLPIALILYTKFSGIRD